MEIEWAFSDGPIKYRTWSSTIRDWELVTRETEQEVLDFIDDVVSQDFHEHVTYSYADEEVDRVMQWWRELRQEQTEEGSCGS